MKDGSWWLVGWAQKQRAGECQPLWEYRSTASTPNYFLGAMESFTALAR
jgi:hypothetical protein